MSNGSDDRLTDYRTAHPLVRVTVPRARTIEQVKRELVHTQWGKYAARIGMLFCAAVLIMQISIWEAVGIIFFAWLELFPLRKREVRLKNELKWLKEPQFVTHFRADGTFVTSLVRERYREPHTKKS